MVAAPVQVPGSSSQLAPGSGTQSIAFPNEIPRWIGLSTWFISAWGILGRWARPMKMKPSPMKPTLPNKVEWPVQLKRPSIDFCQAPRLIMIRLQNKLDRYSLQLGGDIQSSAEFHVNFRPSSALSWTYSTQIPTSRLSTPINGQTRSHYQSRGNPTEFQSNGIHCHPIR